jgi:hypothetical protein
MPASTDRTSEFRTLLAAQPADPKRRRRERPAIARDPLAAEFVREAHTVVRRPCVCVRPYAG